MLDFWYPKKHNLLFLYIFVLHVWKHFRLWRWLCIAYLIHQVAVSRSCSVSLKNSSSRGPCCAALRKVVTGHLTGNTSASVFGHLASKLRDRSPHIWRNIYDMCYTMKLQNGTDSFFFFSPANKMNLIELGFTEFFMFLKVQIQDSGNCLRIVWQTINLANSYKHLKRGKKYSTANFLIFFSRIDLDI